MKTVVLITARLGSTRLQRKHLLQVGDKPILQFLIDAINREFAVEIKAGSVAVVIATSEKPENRTFEQVINSCIVFYGSDENIPRRHLQAADGNGADAIISVDGDDILCSPAAMRSVFRELLGGAKIVNTVGLPLGMNASGYSTEYLRSRVLLLGDGVCETGWGRVFEKADYTTIRLDSLNDEMLRYTLDYQQDFEFFSRLLSVPEISGGIWNDDQIVKYTLQHGLQEITRPVVEEYWRNFNLQKQKEEAGA